MAASLLLSCGNKTQTTSDADSIAVFDQSKIEAEVKAHLDSLITEINEGDATDIKSILTTGKLTLTAEEKKVKPAYLLAPAVADNTTNLSQKYAVLAMLTTDKAVAEAYDMDVEPYKAAIAKLLTEINDPSLKSLEEAKDQKEALQKLSQSMEEEGRLNYYWITTAAATVENLNVLSHNADRFLNEHTDGQVAQLSQRIATILDALGRLCAYDSQFIGLLDGLSPLSDINATNVEDFKKQLTAAKKQIAIARENMLKQ